MSIATVAAPIVPAARTPIRLEWVVRPVRPAGPAGRAKATATRPVRLTRRGRLVRATVALAVVACVLVTLAVTRSATMASATPIGASGMAASGLPEVAGSAASPGGAAMTSGRGSARAIPVPAVRAPRGGDVVVRSGESLWQVAGRVAPRLDPREVVLALREFNGLTSSVVHPGQALGVPAGLT